MIPTRFRDKTGKSLSFPIGSEDLSERLEGVPQYDLLSVAFRSRPTIQASRFQRLLASDQPLPVLRATFRAASPHLSASNQLIEQGWHDERWSLEIYPVPRELKHEAHEQLLHQGLAVVRSWLTSERPATWHSQSHSLTLSYDRARRALRIAED